MSVITLRRADTCRDCGAALAAGDRARYYGRGRIYGMDCHTSTEEDRQARRGARVEAERLRGLGLDPEDQAGLEALRARERAARARNGSERHPSVAEVLADLPGAEEMSTASDREVLKTRKRKDAARDRRNRVADPGEDQADRWNEVKR